MVDAVPAAAVRAKQPPASATCRDASYCRWRSVQSDDPERNEPFGGHGGRLDAARRAWPDAPEPWLDLSTGINPVPWPVGTDAIDLRALPSPEALARLEAAAATHLGAPAEQVVALPGSELALRLLATLPLPPPHRFLAGYGSYAAFGAVAASLDAVAGGTLLLGNPNNPDGRVHAPERLLDAAARGTWLVVDEAFADAVPRASILPHLAPDARVVVLRSFGKFFGLAGVRLGFAVAPAEVAAALRRLLGSWPLSATAIAIGTAAYRDRAWVAASREALPRRAAAFDAMLARHGLTARGDCPLFRLVESDDASALFARLARAGILTRPFPDRPWWLRVGVPGDAAALARVEGALRD